MKSHLLCVVLGVALGFTIIALRRMHQARPAAAPETVLEVNGTKVIMPDFVSRLKGKSGAQVLAELTQELLVVQLADKLGVKLTSDEEAKLKSGVSAILNPDVRDYAWAERRTNLLMRKLILKEAGEAELKRIFELYPEELAEYEISIILLTSESEARAAWKRFQEKILTFEQLAKTYSIAPNPGGKVGWMTLPAIRRMFGSEAADAIAVTAPNTAFPPMYCNQGMMILAVGAIHKKFEEVKPGVENVVIEAKKIGFRRKLLQKAVIHSNLLGPYRENSSQDLLPGETPSPDERQGMPAPVGTPSALPTSGLMRPTDTVTATPTPGLLLPGQ